MGVATAAAFASAAAGAYSANRGAAAQRSAANRAATEQGRQFDQSREDQMPWMNAGRNALARLESVNNGDYSGFMDSPDFTFARDQAMRSLDRSAAARGSLFSGGADADRMQLASGLASQNLNNYTNRLAGIAGVGQNSAQSIGAFGANAANQIGAARMGAANATAQGWNNMAGAIGQGLGDFAGIVGYRQSMGQNWLGRPQRVDIPVQPLPRMTINPRF